MLGHRIRVFVCLIFLGIFLFPTVLQAQEPEEAKSPVFGVVDGYWRAESADELGVQWERITFDWAKMQPNGPGDFENNVIRDEWLEAAQQSNREVVGMIINTPAWASTSGMPSAVPDNLYAPAENPENYWALFLSQLIPTMAEKGIHHWIIWNTPDIALNDAPDQIPTFSGSPEDYYRLIKIAYQTIHSLDPTATVIVGGLAWWNDVALERELYLKRLVDIALDDPQAPENNYFFDGIALNILLEGNPINLIVQSTDSVGDIITQARDILNDADLTDKFIWMTELNALPTLDPQITLPESSAQISLAQQADFIVQGCALALAAGAERVAVYKLYDSNFVAGETLPYGLLHEDNQPRPAFIAYQFVVSLFTDTIQATAARSTRGRLVVLEQPERTIYVMWSAGTEPVDFWVLRNFEDTPLLFDAMGQPLPAPRLGVGIDQEAIFVLPTLPAVADNGVVRVSGTPLILILEGAPRSVWAAVGGQALQLYP